MSVPAHDAVVAPSGEPDGHEKIEITIRKDRAQIDGKTPRQEQRPYPIEAHRCDQCRFESGIIEIT